MDRNSRRLSHQKGNKVQIVTQAPISSTGDDGDMQLQTSGLGAILFVKGQGRWFKFRPSEFSLDGWHGSSSKIRLMPSDFAHGITAGSEDIQYNALFGYLSFVNSSASNQLAVSVAVPIGFIAIKAHIYVLEYGSVDLPTVTVYEGNLSVPGAGLTLGTGTANTEFSLSGGVQASDDHYLSIGVYSVHGGYHATSEHYVRGGYITIVPVLTPERIIEGMTDSDVLGRQS